MRSITFAQLWDVHAPGVDELSCETKRVPRGRRKAFGKAVRCKRVVTAKTKEAYHDVEGVEAIRREGSSELMRLEDLYLVEWSPLDKGKGRSFDVAWYAFLPEDKTADCPVELIACM